MLRYFWVVMIVMFLGFGVLMGLDQMYLKPPYPLWIIMANLIYVVGGPLFLLAYFFARGQEK